MRKWNEHQKFATKMNGMTGLILEPAPDMNNRSASHCMSCSMKQIRNVTDKWIRHAKVCPGLTVAQISKLAPELTRPFTFTQIILTFNLILI